MKETFDIVHAEDGPPITQRTWVLAQPIGLSGLAERWALRPGTQHAFLCRLFDSRLASAELGVTRASQGALALYPYNFPRWDHSQLTSAPVPEVRNVDSVLWFEEDRDQPITRQWLRVGRFSSLLTRNRYPLIHSNTEAILSTFCVGWRNTISAGVQ